MPLSLIDGRFFRIADGKNAIVPTAAEIHGVLFDNVRSIRGHDVSPDDFCRSGIEFGEYLADPIVVLESGTLEGRPQIRCRFVATCGSIEGDVSNDGTSLLDYAIANGRWLPLPDGSTEEAGKLLRSLGLEAFGPITLRQYMRLVRWASKELTVEDRTRTAMAASAIAPLLLGDVPPTFIGHLYPYQVHGYRWLSFMVHNGLGGIVADEMGLGKTIQVICVLLEASARSKKPSLILAPTTLLENWRRELSRFGPSLSVLVHSGRDRTGDAEQLATYDVVVCSIDTAVVDISLLRNVKWNLLIVDEAQNIKNPTAQRTIQLKTIPCLCAVAVTGTPFENRLQDLWSITDFVLPRFLGSLQEFEHDHPDTMIGASMLEPVVSPLILRRTLRQVANDLPERIDIPQPIELDLASAQAYEEIRARISANGRRTGLGALQKLRMFCTHPWLTGHFENIADATQCSRKMERLLQIIEEMAISDAKALIFTSYSESVDLIRAEIAARFGIFASEIDGRVAIPLRQQRVDEFSAFKGAGVLVLNPRAAGVGLNITAANHVIHYNLEWNPAVEDQASARAHRRGQTRVVTVHRLFYTSTVEEVIDERMTRKRQLADAAVVGTTGEDQELDDLLKALRVSPLKNQ